MGASEKDSPNSSERGLKAKPKKRATNEKREKHIYNQIKNLGLSQ
jgi:hypothetical protein